MSIFVVFGKTGRYSDLSPWMVAAYTSEDDAKQHVIQMAKHGAAYGVILWYAPAELKTGFTAPEVLSTAQT